MAVTPYGLDENFGVVAAMGCKKLPVPSTGSKRRQKTQTAINQWGGRVGTAEVVHGVMEVVETPLGSLRLPKKFPESKTLLKAFTQ